MRSISRNIVLVGLLALSGCRSKTRREWTPRDHDPDGSVEPTQQAGGSGGGDSMSAARALFAAQCASCHGTEGRGDGPMAAMFRPADLSDPTLQASRTDEAFARAITRGAGRMPAFGAQLRPEAVTLLVRLIRSWRR